jgi:hypothetical protein
MCPLKRKVKALIKHPSSNHNFTPLHLLSSEVESVEQMMKKLSK